MHARVALFDPFDGQADLSRRLLRAVTEGTFRDDPLRMLRASAWSLSWAFGSRTPRTI